MYSGAKEFLRRGAAASCITLAMIATTPAAGDGSPRPLFISLGETTKPPIGWIEFCVAYDPECKTKPSTPRDVVLTARSWKDLERINLWVNTHVKPMTDM
jgi:predicted transglutaminase-like cysteine proteinase